MSTLDLQPFSGPLTAIAINEWLNKCENKFQLYDNDHPAAKLSEQQKVDHAGDKIADNEVTHDLYDWFSGAKDIKAWNIFKDQLKEEALSADWRARVLEAFFTTKQDGKSAEAYIRELDEWRSVIANSSKLRPIDEYAFNYHMLFHATPAVTAELWIAILTSWMRKSVK